MGIAWGIAAGLLLSLGQYFMSRVALGLVFDSGVKAFVVNVATNVNLYLFLLFNALATVAYLMCLNQKQLVGGFALTFVTMATFVFLLATFIDKNAPSPMQFGGFLLAVAGVVLMNRG